MKKTFLALLTAISLSGCVTVGKQFESSLVTRLQTGKSTHETVRGIFGDPDRMGIDDGDRTWTYLYYKFRIGSQETKDLYIRFDKDGKVKSYSFNSSFPEDKQ